RELKSSPPQVSKALARVEGQLRARLFRRTPTGVSTSAIGRRLLSEIEELVGRFRTLGQRSPRAPVLAIAAPSYLAAAFLPAIARAVPRFRIRALELPPPLVRAYAAEGMFDLALSIGAEGCPKGWVSERLGPVRKALFASPRVADALGPQP